MSISRAGPLNQNDVFRIVNDFDRHYFKTPKPERNKQGAQVIVITQVERMLHSHFPIEIVDMIMRRYLKSSPSVGALMMLYKTTPALLPLHPILLSEPACFINDASKSLLLQLKQVPSIKKPNHYHQLMTFVFKHYFHKLTLDQKLELIRRSAITPWEQKSTSQRLELLGRIQASTAWGQAKVKLQLLSWKVQFAAAWALENNVILGSVVAIVVTFFAVSFLFWIVSFSSFVDSSALFIALKAKWVALCLYGLISIVAAMATSLVFTGLGLALRIPILPIYIQEKGAWIQSVSWNCCHIAFLMLLTVLPSNHSNNDNRISTSLVQASEDLEKLLLQSIDKANITVDQASFVEAQLPDLLDKWKLLTSPSL